jgi:hypothetical protein
VVRSGPQSGREANDLASRVTNARRSEGREGPIPFVDPTPIFLRENYARAETAAAPQILHDEHTFRIAEGAGAYDEDGEDGLAAPLHPALTLLAAASMFAAIAIALGLLAGLALRAI